MWYAFYGETLSSAAGFDDRMDALSRELGVRGRTDAVAVLALEPEPDFGQAGDASELVLELRGLKLMALQKRALSAGVAGEAVEDALEAADPRSALVGLIVEVE